MRTRLGLFLAIFLLAATGLVFAQGAVIRVGAFPNITHPQAMVGKANGWFEKAMGSQVKIDWKSFNAGPSAIEALFAGAIDMTYVGPNPAINGYVRSNGQALRIVAGATSGERRWWCEMTQAFRRRRIFMASASHRRRWAIPKTWRCARG